MVTNLLSITCSLLTSIIYMKAVVIYSGSLLSEVLLDLSFFFSFQVEAVDLIGDGKAPKIPQPEEGATYDKIWKKKEVAKVNTAF